jgi:xanthine dehydrogenase YagS FAD-binding subunit
MHPFIYERADTAQQAIRATTARADTQRDTQFIAGGTMLLDLMKLGSMQPGLLIDINDLKQNYGKIEATPGELRLGALVRMSEAESHPAIIRDYPVIAQTLQLAASAQIRNMASLGGNVLQRTRCEYYRDPSWSACNKRVPGSGCAAIGGVNRKHAILGVSDQCISSYMGDFAQALVVLDATVHTIGPRGARAIPFEKLHTSAAKPSVETILEHGELITGYRIPAAPWTKRSVYIKVRDRQSYEYGLATAAVAMDLHQSKILAVRIALGAVAYKPWRALEAEEILTGKTLDEALATQAAEAAEAAFAHATPHEHNAYKVDLGKRTLVRAVMAAAAMEV